MEPAEMALSEAAAFGLQDPATAWGPMGLAINSEIIPVQEATSTGARVAAEPAPTSSLAVSPASMGARLMSPRGPVFPTLQPSHSFPLPVHHAAGSTSQQLPPGFQNPYALQQQQHLHYYTQDFQTTESSPYCGDMMLEDFPAHPLPRSCTLGGRMSSSRYTAITGLQDNAHHGLQDHGMAAIGIPVMSSSGLPLEGHYEMPAFPICASANGGGNFLRMAHSEPMQLTMQRSAMMMPYEPGYK